MRSASFNVENLFERAKVLDLQSWAPGKPILAAQAELNALLEEPIYTDGIKARILELLTTLGLRRSDDSEFVRLRKIRGQLLRRPRSGPVQVVAAGRPDWIGWVELKTEPVDELAMQHTAMVMRDINADILGVVEADSRPALKRFSDALLAEVHGTPYEQVMLVDGNDDRGIARATGGAVFRKGVWRGPRTKNPWPIYDTLTADVHAASDHAAIYADLRF